jgi:hypothetical protein
LIAADMAAVAGAAIRIMSKEGRIAATGAIHRGRIPIDADIDGLPAMNLEWPCLRH